jgi:cyclopropane fatty-acyl-phospholipid synthase-like methyltransferase
MACHPNALALQHRLLDYLRYARALEVAKTRFQEKVKNISLVCKDFSNASWIKDLSGTFDVAISNGSIHHISDIRKKQLFSEVYDLLNSSGYFINGDLSPDLTS